MVIMKIVSKLTFLGIMLFFSINAYAGQLDSSGLLDTLLDINDAINDTLKQMNIELLFRTLQ